MSSKKAPYRRVAYGLDEKGAWHVEIAVKDNTGKRRRRMFSMAQLALDTRDLWQFLGEAGYVLSATDRRQAQTQLLAPPDQASFQVLTAQGWRNGKFATPYRVYGGASGMTRLKPSEQLDASKWTPVGTLEAWRSDIDAICKDNLYLGFAVSLAFVAPLLPLLRLSTIGFSFVGDPSLGKSTLLAFAGSVWGGDPEKRIGFGETMLKTANAYDKVSQRHRHCLLPLDETHLADQTPREIARTVGAVVHRLASDESKETAIDDTLPRHGSLVYMMSSNHTIEQMFAMAGLPFDGSYTARLIEIGVFGPKGIFDSIPDGFTAHTFVEHVIASAIANRGVAIDAFLVKLTQAREEDEDSLVAWVRKRMAWMSRRLGIDGNVSGEARLGQYFCLVYAAGCLAAKYEVLPWSRSVIAEAVRRAYDAQLHSRSVEKPDPVGRVRRYIEKHRGDFIDVRRHRPKIGDEDFAAGPGFLTETGHGDLCFAFASPHFRTAFKVGGSAEPTLYALKAAGLLRHDKGKLTTKQPIRANKARDRVYCVIAAILQPTLKKR
jgi:putative DNA primase/helicase